VGINIIIGLFGGFLSGLLGIGGGVVFVPALVTMRHLPQKIAQGTTLLIISVTSLLGIFIYKSYGISFINNIHLMIVGIIMGTILGSVLVKRAHPNVIRKTFSLYFLLIAIKMLIE